MKYELFAQRTILMFSSNLILFLSGILLLSILTKNLSVGDYGLWIQVNVTVNLISSIIVLGLPSYAMARYLASEQIKERIREGFYSIGFIILIIGLIVSFLTAIFSVQISTVLFNNNVTIVKLLSLIICIESLNILCYNYFITFQQIKKYSFIVFLKAILSILFISIFILMGYGIIGAVIGFLITEIIVFFVAFIKIICEIGIILPKFTNIKEYLNFSVPTLPGTLSYWIVDSSDRYIIGILLSNMAVGYYSPAYSIGSILTMFSAPISSMLTPILSKNYDQKSETDVKTLMKYAIKYFLAIGIPSLIGLSILAKPILMILSTTEIALNSYFITPFIALSFLLLGATNIIVTMIILEKKTNIIAVAWFIAAILNLILNLLLIPKIGILGAGISTLIAYTIPLILITYFSFKNFKLDFDFLFVIKAFVASAPMFLIDYIWNPLSLLRIIAFVLVSALIYIFILILLKGFQKEEIKFFKKLLSF